MTIPENILIALASVFLTGAGAYFLVIKDTWFIKGQMSLILQYMEREAEKGGARDENIAKNRQDLNAFFCRLKKVESGLEAGNGEGELPPPPTVS